MDSAESKSLSWFAVNAYVIGGPQTHTVVIEAREGRRASQSKTSTHFWEGTYVPEHGIFKIDPVYVTQYSLNADGPVYFDFTGTVITQAELDAEAKARSEQKE
ncbi:hypothetical protein D7V97_07520 [Corallococcus sp. CA053C]|nr:hypothetical protein D7V97_07520 [Corallococcus sp. CA053C]